MRIAIFLMIFSVLIISCDKQAEPPSDNKPNLRALSPDEITVISSTNDFAFNLMHHINEDEPGNSFFISPLSVAYALSMTSNGAAGSTRDSIMRAMSFDSISTEAINASFSTLTEFLYSLDNKTKINVANSIWYEQTLHIQASFESLVQEYYSGKAKGLDFRDQGSKDIVNNWIENETGGKIKNMIGEIPAGTVMFLVNAIYFKSDWTYRFDKNKTGKGDFTLDNGQTILVDMMENDGMKIKHYQDDNISLVDLPYGNEQFAMTIITPRGSLTTDDLVKGLTSEQYSNWMKRTDSLSVTLFMPKFSLEYKTDLKKPLSGMGMSNAFSDGADLSNLFIEKLPLAITAVLHKARIDVDEEGTEAAAATVVEVGETAAISDPLKIVINHPFLFFIHERYSNTILFYGKMMNPILSQ
jgi:serine protease inhibitor